MSSEKTTGLILRMADFSESSRVVVFLTRDFGKMSFLAKGAKRLKSAFESGLDLLAGCQIVFLRKSGQGLHLLTESRLFQRFQPQQSNLMAYYGGYYFAELLDALLPDHDPHPELYDFTIHSLTRLMEESDPRPVIIGYELFLLHELGHLPSLEACLCGTPIQPDQSYAFWVSQGTVLCPACRNAEYSKQISGQTLYHLQQFILGNTTLEEIPNIQKHYAEMQQLLISAITNLLERQPKLIRYLQF